jgi:aspartyl-tRNA(Asn)/glutamyl-tRNA(Gln) amidotransferase subunit C
MSIEAEDVIRVARLAALDIKEQELPDVVRQLDRIMGYVEQLSEVPADEQAAAAGAGPAAVALRDDVVAPVPLAHPPEAMAPAFTSGFFTVPVRNTLEES